MGQIGTWPSIVYRKFAEVKIIRLTVLVLILNRIPKSVSCNSNLSLIINKNNRLYGDNAKPGTILS